MPSPDALRGEARIRGLKNELVTARNRFEQEIQVRRGDGACLAHATDWGVGTIVGAECETGAQREVLG